MSCLPRRAASTRPTRLFPSMNTCARSVLSREQAPCKENKIGVSPILFSLHGACSRDNTDLAHVFIDGKSRVGRVEAARLGRQDMQLLVRPPDFSPAKSYGFQRSEEHTSELQSLRHLVCRLLLEKK